MTQGDDIPASTLALPPPFCSIRAPRGPGGPPTPRRAIFTPLYIHTCFPRNLHGHFQK